VKNGPWLPKLPVPDMLVAGILLMLAGDFMFALNDAMGKWLVASFSVGQVVLVRSIGAFLILGPMIAFQGAGKLFRVERVALQVLRVVAATLDGVQQPISQGNTRMKLCDGGVHAISVTLG